MIFFLIYAFSALCLVLIILSYHVQDVMEIIPSRVWIFLTFLCFIPIFNTIILFMIAFNHDNPQVEDLDEALKELEELDKKLEELFNKFK